MPETSQGEASPPPTSKTKSKITGRPPAEIGLKHFKKMCAYHFTVEEMAAALNISKRTLVRRLRDDPLKTLWQDGEANGRQLIKRRGFELMALDNSAGVQAWIHQTKHILKWTDKSLLEHTGKDGAPIPIRIESLTNAQIDQLIERIQGGSSDGTSG
jgi:hypothetical protein